MNRKWTARVAIILLLVGATPVSAHDENVWYSTKWKSSHSHTGLNITWRFTPSFPTGNKRDRVKDGFAQWNALGEQMTFEFLGEGSSSYTYQCQDTQPYNGIFWMSFSGASASTLVCSHAVTGIDTGHHFSMRFNSGVSWYDGTGDPGSNQNDFWGAASHEAGHATGGWLGSNPGHFPSNFDVCDGTLEIHTMCQLTSSVPKAYRALETHDKHTFQNRYP